MGPREENNMGSPTPKRGIRALFTRPQYDIFSLRWKAARHKGGPWGYSAILPNGHSIAIYYNETIEKMVLSSWITSDFYATTGIKANYRYFDAYFGRRNWKKLVANYEKLYRRLQTQRNVFGEM